MAGERTTTSYPPLREMLGEMQSQGEFLVSVLTSSDGLPLVTVPAEYDGDMTSAMAALLQRVSDEAQDQLGMSMVDEIMLRDREANRLVCRRFEVEGEELILVALVPPGHSYRRVMNRAVRHIRESIRAF